MADNPPPPPPQKSGLKPTLPATGMTGRLPSALPRKGGTGKIVVMLSSVAKAPPGGPQSLPKVTPAAGSLPPKAVPAPAPSEAPGIVLRPPVLPPKQVTAGKPPVQAPPKLSTTTYVKLPPKTSVPQLTSLSGLTVPAPVAKAVPAPNAAPPPLPSKTPEPPRIEIKKSGAQHIPPIKLNEFSTPAESAGESIFLKAEPNVVTPKPAEAKLPEPLIPPKSTPPPASSPAPVPEAREKPAPVVAPPLIPPARVEVPPAAPPVQPPSLRPPPLPVPSAKPVESPVALPSAFHVAPPMIEKAPEVVSEKLPQPHLPAPTPPPLPVEARKGDLSPALPESPGIHKVPAMIQPEMPAIIQPPSALPAKPLLPPSKPSVKGPESWLKKSTPLVLSSTSKVQIPRPMEAKPALKPPTLPKRALPIVDDSVVATPPPIEPPAGEELTKAPEEKALETKVAETKVPEKAELPPPTAPIVLPPVEKVSLPAGDEPGASKVLPTLVGAAALATTSSKRAKQNEAKADVAKPDESAPMTRSARAKRRRLVSTIAFYAVLVVTLAVLYLGSLYVGRETRVEGQIIPPAGMTLNSEVWIVSDFRELASGIADDLAKERTPLLQEIQERQDHVQRAQADVASREERIRLVQENIQAAKDEITNTVKQARDATQQIWDVDGAQIDDEYKSKFDQLRRTISDRAKSLNLKYQPDPSFESPEVWANAYRLALYEVPTGVDSVKEHQWLSDQMKQWRDYEKSLDDRKQQLRDKAAQIKLAPAPKITDLNTKIDQLQQRIDSTAAEEVPLKGELQQAQADLVAAQSAEAGLDDKYYKQLDSLPEEAITKHISLHTNGRFSWVDDDVFGEGENEHHYWMFARATRADGRQYWMLAPFSLEKYHKWCFLIDPESFVSTRTILRPNLPPDEQAQ